MHSYVIGNFNGEQGIARDDGWAIPTDMNNRMAVRFVWEWENGAVVVDENGVAIPFTPARLSQLGAHMERVCVEPEDR